MRAILVPDRKNFVPGRNARTAGSKLSARNFQKGVLSSPVAIETEKARSISSILKIVPNGAGGMDGAKGWRSTAPADFSKIGKN